MIQFSIKTKAFKIAFTKLKKNFKPTNTIDTSLLIDHSKTNIVIGQLIKANPFDRVCFRFNQNSAMSCSITVSSGFKRSPFFIFVVRETDELRP